MDLSICAIMQPRVRIPAEYFIFTLCFLAQDRFFKLNQIVEGATVLLKRTKIRLDRFCLDDLAGHIRAVVRHSRHAVRHDRLSLRDGEEELVVHADVNAKHDAVGDLERFLV